MGYNVHEATSVAVGEQDEDRPIKLTDRRPARVAIVLAVILNSLLPRSLDPGPLWLAPVVIGVMLIALIAVSPRYVRLARVIASVLIGLLTLRNIASAALLVAFLVDAHLKAHGMSAVELLRDGGLVWATNVLVFALWYWELDSDGPYARDTCFCARDFDHPDFLFPQMQIDPRRVRIDPDWKPSFLDYLYVSFTNALAVSPTDTMPLTHWAKMLMLVQSLTSFTTVALILARSVNILS